MKSDNSSLLSERFKDDPRVQSAKQTLIEVLKEYAQTLKVKDADPALASTYQEVLSALNQLRGAPTYYPYLGSGFGYGALVELLDGSVKYDGITGIGVHYLGHSHPAIIDASLNAALENTLMQGHLQQNAITVELLNTLCAAAGMPHGFLSTSGAMANENALKIAFQARAPASRILAFSGNFSGRTCTLSQITDKSAFRQGLPLNIPVDYLPFLDPEHPEESAKRALKQLDQHLLRYPSSHALLLCELIQGEGGFHPGSKDFFESLFIRCKEANVLIIADEIQTFGRTSKLFAYQHFGLEGYIDIVTIGKLLQVCATLFSTRVAPKPGLLSQTFTGSSSALYGGKAILHELQHGGYLGPDGKNERLGAFFRQGLANLSKEHPEWLKGPFGIGAMIAFTPFDGLQAQAEKVLHTLFKNGLIAFSAGSKPCRVRLLLPMGAVDEALCRIFLRIIEKSLSECFDSTRGNI